MIVHIGYQLNVYAGRLSGKKTKTVFMRLKNPGGGGGGGAEYIYTHT